MNRDNAMHKWKNALHGIGLAVENLSQLPPNASPEEVNQARLLDRKAWQQLGDAHRNVIEAILESIGF
jgi:hypothetical protein